MYSTNYERTKLTATVRLEEKRKTKQTSAHSGSKGLCNQTDFPTVQNVLLIWLDNDIDEKSIIHHKTITQLRRTINTTSIFTDRDECIDFLTDIYKENVYLIISDTLCQNVVPLVDAVEQLQNVFIFARDKIQLGQWAKDCTKIKGVFTDISPICDVLKQAAQQCEQNSNSISVVATDDDLSKKNLDQLPPSFMYTQILKEILLSIHFEQKHFMEFICYCRNIFAENGGQLKIVDKLQKEYRSETSIWWYTYECFLYSMLNRALRVMDVDIIIKIGFFICNLHRQIAHLHDEQFGDQNSNDQFTVYRGQGLSKTDFEQMNNNRGGLIAFNNFLSTSRDRDVPLLLAESNQASPSLIGILFVIIVDPAKSSTHFASLKNISQFDIEDEILFSMHTVFRIGQITSIGENDRLFQVELTLTSNNDQNLCQLTDHIRNETFPNSEGWYRLGLVLLKMGQPEKAGQVYEILLNEYNDENAKASIYQQLACVKADLGQYEEAMKLHQKILEMQRETLPSSNSESAGLHNSIGAVYRKMDEHSKALTSFEKALAIQQQSLPPNHPELAISYNNIGTVCTAMGDYMKALSFYEKTLTIYQKTLPANHPDFASSYNNIGTVYGNMCEYSEALSSFKKALEIQEQSLPSNHSDLAYSHNNIGNVYDKMGEYTEALSSYEKAFEIQRQSLHANHPELAASYDNIGTLHRNMGNYLQALSSHEKALAIRQQSLPANHLSLAISYNNIGNVYDSLGEYSKALSFYERTLAIQQQSLRPNHPDVATSYSNIGTVYYNRNEYEKALLSEEKALAIREQSVSSNHPDMATSYHNIGTICRDMGDYSKALLFYKKTLAIQERSLSRNYSRLTSSYNNIGNLYKRIGEYSEALSFYEKALAIEQQSVPLNHSILAYVYDNIGFMHSNMDNYSNALLSFERALAIRQKSLPSNHPDLALTYNNIGVVYKSMRQYPKALSSLEKVLAIQQQSLSPNHPELAALYSNIGIFHEIMGNYSKARISYKHAVAIGRCSLPPSHPDLEDYQEHLSRINRKL